MSPQSHRQNDISCISDFIHFQVRDICFPSPGFSGTNRRFQEHPRKQLHPNNGWMTSDFQLTSGWVWIIHRNPIHFWESEVPLKYHMDVSENAGTQQPWVFPTTNNHFGVFWGYHHLRNHPYRHNILEKNIHFVSIFQVSTVDGTEKSYVSERMF